MTLIAVTKKDWREREALRVSSGKYKPVPWAGEAFLTELPADDARREHFVHISEKDPYMLAYTPKASDGELDRRVPIKPGRYLQRYYADVLSAEQIKHWAGQVRGSGLSVAFTDNAEKICSIYQSAGIACMSHSVSHYRAAHFNGGKHPTAAYAGSDLRLAYARDPSGNVTGRAIVWPEKKLFSRCYGDTEALKKALEAEGFTYGLLDGAKLTVIPLLEEKYGAGKDPHLTAPYIDHIKWARWDAEASTFTLQSRATGATHSVQHGDGIAYPIPRAPQRPASASGESILTEWKRLCALEAGTPIAAEEPKKSVSAPVEGLLNEMNRTMAAMSRSDEQRRLHESYARYFMTETTQNSIVGQQLNILVRTPGS